ncbi:MAG: HAMP domain-containing sensor histidine kinase [Oscillospiraceae bacterium]
MKFPNDSDKLSTSNIDNIFAETDPQPQPALVLKKEQKNSIDIEPIKLLYHMVDNTIRRCNPLIQLILKDASLKPEHFSALVNVKISTLQLGGKCKKLSELYVDDANISKLRFATFDVSDFLTELTDSLNRLISNYINGEVHFKNYTDKIVYAEFDPNRLSSALLNLVDNAIVHGKTDNKNVYISLREKGDNIHISVKDKGEGIKESEVENLLNVTEPTLYSIDGVPSNISGIGLALCKKYVTEMGGKLSFKNQKIGVKFTISLPKSTGKSSTGMREVKDFNVDIVDLLMSMADSLYLSLKECDSNNEIN